jgi:hypothetical protein
MYLFVSVDLYSVMGSEVPSGPTVLMQFVPNTFGCRLLQTYKLVAFETHSHLLHLLHQILRGLSIILLYIHRLDKNSEFTLSNHGLISVQRNEHGDRSM